MFYTGVGLLGKFGIEIEAVLFKLLTIAKCGGLLLLPPEFTWVLDAIFLVKYTRPSSKLLFVCVVNIILFVLNKLSCVAVLYMPP